MLNKATVEFKRFFVESPRPKTAVSQFVEKVTCFDEVRHAKPLLLPLVEPLLFTMSFACRLLVKFTILNSLSLYTCMLSFCVVYGVMYCSIEISLLFFTVFEFPISTFSKSVRSELLIKNF